MKTRTALTLSLVSCLNAQTSEFKIPDIGQAPMRAHIAFLADDLLEGRGTGERGGDLAVLYLENQIKALGLQPGNGKSYRQSVNLVGINTLPSSKLQLAGHQNTLDLEFDKDIVAGANGAELKVDAPLVFVGHATRAAGRDDFKGMDIKGKVMVCFVGPVPECLGSCCDAIHYAGRWRAKLELGLRMGAAGVIMVHSTKSAGYDWNVAAGIYNRERYQLESKGPDMLRSWISDETGRKLMKAMGKDLDQVRLEAESKDFKPFEMPFKLKGAIHSKSRVVVQHNVMGLLPGTDPKLKDELLVYSAHWDHLGKDPKTGRFYNGAVDNGSAVAAELAVAQEAIKHPTRRSQMFLFTCAEEPGMIGAEAFVKGNVWPTGNIVANLNFESLNVWGPTKDLGLMGAERSSLYTTSLKVLQSLDMKPAPSRPDPTGLYFRTDHFPFAQAGIPAFSPGFSLEGGWEYLDPKHAEQAKLYVQTQYHKTTDRFDPTWDLRGLVQQARFFLGMGMLIANEDQRPTWNGNIPEYGR